jgi:transposase
VKHFIFMVICIGMKRSTDHYKDLPALRRQTLELSASGTKPTEICRRLGVSRSTVWRWLKLDPECNPAALAKPIGRPRRLSDIELSSVTEALLRGPEANGFETPLWTLKRIAEVIRLVTGVTYNSNYVAHLLHGMGWSCQKPERRARERNEEAIDNWVKTEWPLIKKKHMTWAPR